MSTVSQCIKTTACSSHKRKPNKKVSNIIEKFVNLNLEEETNKSETSVQSEIASNYFSMCIVNDEK